MKHLSLAVLLVGLLAGPGAAVESGWQPLAPGVAVRLIGSGVVSDEGKTLIGIEIDMPQTTKTYWQLPGETGLPTLIEVTTDAGTARHRVAWPFPRRDSSTGFTDYVYEGHTVLPVRLRLDDAARRVDVSLSLGICEEICIPARADLAMDLDGPEDVGHALRLRQALAEAPIRWEGDPDAIGAVRYDRQANALLVELGPGAPRPEDVIAIFEGAVVAGAPEPEARPGLARFPVLARSLDPAIASVDLIFTTADGAYRLERPLLR